MFLLRFPFQKRLSGLLNRSKYGLPRALQHSYGFVILLVGWFMRILWDSLSRLQAADMQLSDKVSRIEILEDKLSDYGY